MHRAGVGVPEGFTPAYAGNTCMNYFTNLCTKVHPRIRGEYSNSSPREMPSSGSPPHTRGIPWDFQVQRFFFRFTPAYAGNTVHLYYVMKEPMVHPRIRGEYHENAGEPCRTPGSPPAYAGNTSVECLGVIVD